MQATFIIERALTFRLRKARKQAYDMVVRSRQKDPDFWTPYVEEFHNPPNQLARKKAKEQVFWMRMGSPLIKYILHKGRPARFVLKCQGEEFVLTWNLPSYHNSIYICSFPRHLHFILHLFHVTCQSVA